MKNQKGFTITELTFVLFYLVMIIGWCANIYKIATNTLPLVEFGMFEVLRIIGIFMFPLGSVLGYF